MIKNNVMGKKITRTYTVKAERCNDGFLTRKPCLKSDDSVEWVNILTFDGTNIRSNNYDNYSISTRGDEKPEEITIFKEEFRADKNEMFLYTNKEIEIREVNKDESKEQLNVLIEEYNSQEISRDLKLSDYCRLHKLDPRFTDVYELRKVVFSNEQNKQKGFNWDTLVFQSDSDFLPPLLNPCDSEFYEFEISGDTEKITFKNGLKKIL